MVMASHRSGSLQLKSGKSILSTCCLTMAEKKELKKPLYLLRSQWRREEDAVVYDEIGRGRKVKGLKRRVLTVRGGNVQRLFVCRRMEATKDTRDATSSLFTHRGERINETQRLIAINFLMKRLVKCEKESLI